MKHYLFTILLALSFVPTVLAQTKVKTKKHPNLFDTTLAKKHELIIAPGFTAHSLWNNQMSGPAGGSLSIEYARVFKSNHFLRTGIRFAQDQVNASNKLETPATLEEVFPDYPGQSPFADYFSHQYTSRSEHQNVYGSLFVGYEYGVGRKSFRFTFGADINFGYNSLSVFEQENWFTVDRTYSPATNFFHYDIQAYRSGQVDGQAHHIFLAVTPRLGLRRDFGRRFALALTFTPQVGYSQRVGYSESQIGDRPYYYYAPKSMWFAKANADLRLIIKLGKS